MRRFHVRNEIIKALKEKGLYVEQKDNEMQIPICSSVVPSLLCIRLTCFSRSGDVVEQILKPQWWISCKPMAEEVIRVRPFSIPIFWQLNVSADGCW